MSPTPGLTEATRDAVARVFAGPFIRFRGWRVAAVQQRRTSDDMKRCPGHVKETQRSSEILRSWRRRFSHEAIARKLPSYIFAWPKGV